MAENDHLAEISGDSDDPDSDYGRGWRHGYDAGFRAASQPSSYQPVAGTLVKVRVIPVASDA